MRGGSADVAGADDGDFRTSHELPRRLYRWMLGVGCWMLDVGCWMLDVGCWMLDVGCWMLDVGCWAPVVLVGGLRREYCAWWAWVQVVASLVFERFGQVDFFVQKSLICGQRFCDFSGEL